MFGCIFPPCRDKIDMAVRLFDALKVEAQHFRLSIQEATNSLATAYKVMPQAVGSAVPQNGLPSMSPSFFDMSPLNPNLTLLTFNDLQIKILNKKIK